MMPLSPSTSTGLREAELADRAGDQRHLRLAVGAGVAGVGDQRRDRAVVEGEGLGGLDLAQADGHLGSLPRGCAFAACTRAYREV